MPRTYADNSMNRSLGRVGMEHGTAVHSRSSSGSSGGNSSSGFSASSQRTYVDNSMNRNLGRVGMEHGTAVHSRASERSYSPSSDAFHQRTYVDNSMNRSLGRVGMAHGTAVHSRASERSYSPSSDAFHQRTYVDNSMNRGLGRVGMAHGTAVHSRSSESSSPRTYVDNSFNRTEGRVGKPLGSAPISKGSKSSRSVKSIPKRVYVDNVLNRRLGRVGKPVGSMPTSKSKETTKLRKALRDYEEPLCDLEQDELQSNLWHVSNPLNYDPLADRSGMAFQQQQHQQMQPQKPQYPADPALTELLQELLDRMAIWKDVKDEKSREYQVSKTSSYRNKAPVKDYSKEAFTKYDGAVIQYEQVTLGIKIGHGGFGDIHEGKWNEKKVAIKKLRVQRVSRKRLDQFVDEINVFHQLDHKNIVKFYGACTKTPNLCMVMELMEGSLYDKLHLDEHPFSMDNKMFMVKEFSCGLEYLHSQEIAHCDIKSSNVLLSIFDDNEIQVKLTDFGLSLMKNDAETTSSMGSKLVRDIGTPRYSPPEILRGDLLDRNAMMQADVYSFGLVVHEIFTEEEPFSELNVHQLREHVGNRGKTLDLSFFRQERGEKMRILERVLENCWSAANNRPTIGSICNEFGAL